MGGEYISGKEGIAVGEVFVEDGHERGHVVFEEFWDVLTVQVDV
jgi:hypothetical protein